ncbi:MAG: hypothetical protein ABSG86_05465 [Thermoguttaceae bacterium]|jgi:hypothetical protein
MVKHVFAKVNPVRPGALAILGWLAFVVGVVVEETWLKLMLLSAARVLP